MPIFLLCRDSESFASCTAFLFHILAFFVLTVYHQAVEHYPQYNRGAIANLDCTISEFMAMKMQPLVDWALRHKEMSKAHPEMGLRCSHSEVMLRYFILRDFSTAGLQVQLFLE